MTTSILSHLPHELTGHDLQVVRDYALEAPWEWRRLLQAMVAHIEDTKARVSKAEDELSAFQLAAEAAVREIRAEVLVYKDDLTKVKKTPVGAIMQSITESLDALEEKLNE